MVLGNWHKEVAMIRTAFYLMSALLVGVLLGKEVRSESYTIKDKNGNPTGYIERNSRDSYIIRDRNGNPTGGIFSQPGGYSVIRDKNGRRIGEIQSQGDYGRYNNESERKWGR